MFADNDNQNEDDNKNDNRNENDDDNDNYHKSLYHDDSTITTETSTLLASSLNTNQNFCDFEMPISTPLNSPIKCVYGTEFATVTKLDTVTINGTSHQKLTQPRYQTLDTDEMIESDANNILADNSINTALPTPTPRRYVSFKVNLEHIPKIDAILRT